MGFDVSCIGVAPDGRNINLACGSTAPDALARLVVDGQHAVGVAFDGDGDRAICGGRLRSGECGGPGERQGDEHMRNVVAAQGALLGVSGANPMDGTDARDFVPDPLHYMWWRLPSVTCGT